MAGTSFIYHKHKPLFLLYPCPVPFKKLTAVLKSPGIFSLEIHKIM